MTPSPMPTPALKMFAAGLLAVLMLGITAMWWSSRSDQSDPRAASGSVRIVAAGSDMIDEKKGLPSALPTAMPDADPALALQTLVASSFPGLSDVETQCSRQACAIEATATVPEGGQDLANYEKMIRFDIPAILQQHGHALTELPQVEDIGDGSVRIILHASGGR